MLEVGGDSTSTYIPLKVNNDGTGDLQGFNIFTTSGTKLFDATTGFTQAAFTDIAEATGASVSSVSKTSSGDANSDSQKITLNGQQTITVKAQKNAGFGGFASGNTPAAALSSALAQIPDSVTVKVLHNTSNNRSTASQVGGTLSFTAYSSGTQTTTQYRLNITQESEQGYNFAQAVLNRASYSNSSMSQTFSASGSGVGSVGPGTATFTSDGNFTLEFTHTIGTGDNYYWIEIGGSGSSGNGTVGDVTDDSAVRTLTLTAASGSTFNVSGGDGNESSDDVNNATITLAAGNGLTNGGDFTTNQSVTETITFDVAGGDGIAVSANEVEVDVDGTTIELSNTNGSGQVRAKTAAIANGGTALATADQIHTFVTGLGYTTNSGTVTEAFKTIAVSGQSNVVADSATDTLTLAAGSNMTITTNASGDTITFASSGGGGSGLPSGMTYSSSILDVTGQIRATGDVTAFYLSLIHI